MLRVFLTITFIVAVEVSAHGHCKDATAASDPKCQCGKLLKPQAEREQFKNIVKTCAQENGITLPGEGRRRVGRHSPGEFLDRLPEAVRSCIRKQVLTNIGALGDDGESILQNELNDHILQNINTGRNSVTITDDQYSTITTAIPQCSAQNTQLFDIFKCVMDSCITALG